MNTWEIQEDRFDPKQLLVDETIYTIGNGYFGTRGAFEEGYLGNKPATLLYGVFDSIPIGKEELANAPDWLTLKLFVNGERFRLDKGKIHAFQRTLDMRRGILTRRVNWESEQGIRINIVIERFASLDNEHVGAIHYNVTLEQCPQGVEEVSVGLWAVFNTAVGNNGLMHWETIEQGHAGELSWLQTQTRSTHVQLAQVMSFTTKTADVSKDVLDSDIAPSIRLQTDLTVGETLHAEKVVVMYTSRDVADPLASALAQLREIAADGSALHEAGTQVYAHEHTTAYDALRAAHERAWSAFWEASDIVIEGDEKAQQAIRYNIFQLRISASFHDDRYSVAAKGLTGFGYLGHIFHDTEIFMLPFYTYVFPDVARNLLLYRYHLLPAAREKAAANGFQGAQYPWESTLDGKEATPVSIVHPESGELIPVLNGFIELHITASVAFATWNYWHVTGDDEFLREFGAEILLNTAEFWVSRAEKNEARNDYEISNVIGPDEWHEHVNNNAYTNYMASWNIRVALDILQRLRDTDPGKAEELTAQLDLTEQQLNHWRDVSARMRLPQNTQTGLFEQFDGFFQLERLDQEKYKGRTASYQAIFGLKGTQKYQIVKQADVLMLLTVLREEFDQHVKQVNWDYYFPITDHDYGSSLTPALHTILACELGHIDIAYRMFMKGALVDIENLRGNTPEGIHDACCGAVWQALVFGFAGVKLTDGGFETQPSWPDGWTRIAFQFVHKGERVKVDLRR